MEITVEGKKRAEGSKPNALRRSGLIPANLYGHNGTESIHLTLEAKTVETLLKQASVNNTLIQLNISDLPWRGKALLREVQRHPTKRFPYHLSFFSVAAQDTVEVEVPLHFVGEAPGVKIEGGALDTVLTHIQVRCAPDRIPETIEIDVSNMNIGDVVYLQELVLPEGVSLVSETNDAVVSVLAPQITPEIIEAQEAAADAEIATAQASEAEQKEPQTDAETGG
ncbi:LSU ribosomal protein L25P [Gloeocapsa sp. PCC 7428]|uniref:50S ribosomal protein L25/general stress protein Ctc n=1 Tax=Gloeocapsa sp. PCC 7428 TaxID=1173026 RepID=UPI0002A5E049|nr:50S ribosomal protein L25/general stress protein Ctc [Gloeocapsa sp. PCC 7428]AFZ31659.1 LSU ribosomal protein L25P [Gloeocapsa sp. PCC 7428]